MYYNRTFLKFRFRQLGKIVQEIPIPYMLILGIMILFLLYGLHHFMDRQEKAATVGGCFLLLIYVLHIKRSDYHFMQLVEEQPERICCVDYWLLSIPLSAIIVLQGYYSVVLGIVVGCLLISFKKQPSHRAKNGISPPQFIPSVAFEYRASIRKYGIGLLVIYVSAYAGLVLPYVSIALLWFFTCMQAEAFCCAEPIGILCIQELPPDRFLLQKLKLNVQLYACAILPVCLIYTILYPAHWWLVAVFIVLGSLSILLMIVSKYASYQPNTRIAGGQIAISLSLFGILFPVLAPLTLFLLIKKYLTARRNLIPYLHAYN